MEWEGEGSLLYFTVFGVSCTLIFLISVGTLESVKQVEMLTEDTIIYHQLHKRVWPSTQRETLFASHLCSLTNAPRPDNMVGRTWMVCNFSINRDDFPVSGLLLTVLVCLHEYKALF